MPEAAVIPLVFDGGEAEPGEVVMARPPSWIQRLPAIRKTVENSQVTHYTSTDLQRMFGLQDRRAREMFEMLPTVKMGGGNSIWVERQALMRFLERVAEAEDVHGLFVQMRDEKERPSRKRPHTLVRREFDQVDPADLAPWMQRGQLTVQFETAQQLFDALWRVAIALQENLDRFVELYEPEQPMDAERVKLREEKDFIQAEIEAMRARWEQREREPTAV